MKEDEKARLAEEGEMLGGSQTSNGKVNGRNTLSHQSMLSFAVDFHTNTDAFDFSLWFALFLLA